MYTVKPDGSIACDTIEEALQLQRIILGKQSQSVATSGQTISQKLINKLSPASQFLSLLRPYNGKVITSEEMAKIVGTASSTGIGPKLRHMKNSLLQEGKQLDEILVPTKSDSGYSAWKVRIQSNLPSA